MKTKIIQKLSLIAFSLIIGNLAQAQIKVSCQPITTGTQCDFSGSGSDLSNQILNTLNSYPSNLMINILPGSYTMSPIEIKRHDNITFHLSANTKLTAVDQTDSSWKDVKAFISVMYTQNFVLSGDDPDTSIIDGQGAPWWQKDHDKRPEFIYFKDVNSLAIHGISLHNSPKYNIEINHGSNININNIIIDAPKDSPNTDGINMTSVSNVNITNIQVTNGDDCVAINADPGSNNQSKHIQFTNSTCNYSHGVSIGSDVHNIIADVTVDHITLNQSVNGLRIKTHCDSDDCSDTKDSVVKNITYRNITMNGVVKPILYDLTFDNKNHKFSLVTIKNITYDQIQAINSGIPAAFICEKSNQCSPINISNVLIDTGGLCQGVNGSDPTKVKTCPFNLD